MCVVLPAVIAFSRAARDQPRQRIHLALIELDQWRSHRTGGTADGTHAGLHDRHRITFVPVSDVDVRQHELPELLEDFDVVAAANSGVETLRPLRYKVEDRGG